MNGKEVVEKLRYENKVDKDTLMWGPLRRELLAYITALEAEHEMVGVLIDGREHGIVGEKNWDDVYDAHQAVEGKGE